MNANYIHVQQQGFFLLNSFRSTLLTQFIQSSRDRARIFKLLRNPRIDSKDYIPPAYVAWRAGTTTLFSVLYTPEIVQKFQLR